MTAIGSTLKFGSIIVSAQLGIGILGVFVPKPSFQFVSTIQHFSGGVITAAIAIELYPLLLDIFTRTAANYVCVISAYCVAILFFSFLTFLETRKLSNVLLVNTSTVTNKEEEEQQQQTTTTSILPHPPNNNDDNFSLEEFQNPFSFDINKEIQHHDMINTDVHQHHHSDNHNETTNQETNDKENNSDNNNNIGNKKNNDNDDKTNTKRELSFLKRCCSQFQTIPIVEIFVISAGLFLDGLLYSLSFIFNTTTGLIIAIAFAVETAVLGFLTSTTLRASHISRLKTVIVCVALTILTLLGVILGSLIFTRDDLPLALFFLSFGSATFLYMIIDCLLISSRPDPSATSWLTKLVFYVGFAAIFFLNLALHS